MNAMQEIIIDEQFKQILPALDEHTYAWLEENLLTYGCLQPLVLWDNMLIDGHNRFEIIKKHNLPFSTISMEFGSRDDVIIWIISTQIARRSLNPLQLSYYRGLHYNTEKRPRGDISKLSQNLPEAQNGTLGGSTANRLAEIYNVSRNTIKRDALIAIAIDAIGKVSPDIKTDILAGRVRISRKHLQELATGTEEDIAALVKSIEDGTFESRRRASGADVDDWLNDANGSDMPDNSNSMAMQPWENTFSKITGDFQSNLRKITANNDTVAVKTALRSYIKMLEDLYSEI